MCALIYHQIMRSFYSLKSRQTTNKYLLAFAIDHQASQETTKTRFSSHWKIRLRMSSLRAQILLCYKEILMIGAQTGIYSTHRAKLMIDCQTLYLKVTFNLYQIINEPTRYFSNQPTILDLIITDSLHLLLGSGVTPPPPPL